MHHFCQSFRPFHLQNAHVPRKTPAACVSLASAPGVSDLDHLVVLRCYMRVSIKGGYPEFSSTLDCEFPYVPSETIQLLLYLHSFGNPHITIN